MGVHGLWELLAPVGRRVSVETLAGKKLAIDASIWMIQFMKAMRDEKGEMVRNAHILGFFRRICKLLYLRTKPVFVFDGGTPALKRRTVIARRRQRENAQVKIRKTAEKLLLNHLKTLRLKELAADLHKQRKENDAKGKGPVESEIGKEKGKQKEGADNVAGSLSQEELDEMLAASIAAEENEGFGIGASTSSAPENEVFGEDDDEDEEMILPEMHGKVDPAVLAALPPSMQLDLLVQMRERLMAENRQKYQKVKKAPASFSELQIEAYLKTVAFRREIDEVQKSASGRGIGGVQTSRIASEANREFIFSSSFTGDKQALTSIGQERNGADQSQPPPPPVESSSNTVNKDRPTKVPDVSAGPTMAESGNTYDDEIGTYLDERGRLRVSRVRALGIRMTRDLQRNLDLMKEMDQEIVENNEKGNNESATTRNSSGALDDAYHKILQPQATDINNGVNTEVGKIKEPLVSNGAPIEISFETTSEPDGYGDNDDDLFARLVVGDSITDFSVDNSTISNQSLHIVSDIEWEDGVIEGKGTEYQNEEDGMNDEGDIEWEDGDGTEKHHSKGPLGETSAHQEVNTSRKEDAKDDGSMDDFHENHSLKDKSIESQNVGNTCDVGEVEWEDGNEDIQLKSLSFPGERNTTVTKGALEEEASLQEAIRRSLEDISDCKSMEFQENHPSERGRGTAGESTDCVFAHQGKEGPGVSTSADGLHRPSGSLDDLDNIYSATKTSFIESIPERTNLDPNLSTRDDSLSVLLAGDVFLGTDTPVGGDAKEQPLDNYGEDSNGFGLKKLGDACIEKTGHNRSNSAVSGSSHVSLLDSGSADAKHIAQVELDVHFCSTENLGKTSADSVIGVDPINRNDYQDDKILEDCLEGEMSFLGKEREELGNEQRRHERDAESVNNEMFTECQELLQMFGLPYIIAPMEAEAQCAFMELTNLVDGVVTDDSDAFLFGAQCVYKNIFDDRKYVETYLMKDIENELGLDREKLIHMALLLGSDYTEGISGVGIVNAIEVVNAFRGKDGLREFREWIESPDPSILGKSDAEAGGSSRKEGSKVTDDTERKKQIFKNKHRNVSKNWHVSSFFPSDAVISAYVSPQVDKSTEPFAWGKPDLFVLRKLCWEKFAWGASKADELLLPVLKEYNKHETQLRIEAFYTFNERFAKIRSKRIEKAVKGITASKSSALTDETPQPSTKRGKKRKTKTHDDEGNQLQVDGGATSNQDNTMTGPTTESLKKGQIRIKNSRKNLEDSSRGRQSGRGRGQRSGRGRKKTDSKTIFNFNDASSSENDEDVQFHTSEEAPQLRRSSRPRKSVNYNATDEFDNPNKEETPFLSECTMPKEKLADQETGDADKTNHDSVNEAAGIGTGVMDEMDRSLLDDDQTKDPSHHGLEPDDYLHYGGGFCLAEDDEDNDPNSLASIPTNDTMLENTSTLTGADPMVEVNGESNAVTTPRPPNEDKGTHYNMLNMNDYTSRNDNDDVPKNSIAISLRAMPNLRKKRRKN